MKGNQPVIHLHASPTYQQSRDYKTQIQYFQSCLFLRVLRIDKNVSFLWGHLYITVFSHVMWCDASSGPSWHKRFRTYAQVFFSDSGSLERCPNAFMSSALKLLKSLSEAYLQHNRSLIGLQQLRGFETKSLNGLSISRHPIPEHSISTPGKSDVTFTFLSRIKWRKIMVTPKFSHVSSWLQSRALRQPSAAAFQGLQIL